MVATSFDQFRRFSTDAYGLERLLRFLQASVQLLMALVAHSPLAYKTIANTFDSRAVRRPLAEVASRIGLVRRFIRFFRFLDAFTNSYTAFTSLANTSNGKGSTSIYLRRTLGGLASTFDGLYLLLEATTLVNSLAIEGLTIMDKELYSATKLESQRCWFLALLFGALSCTLQLLELQNTVPVRTAPAKRASSNAATSEDEKAVLETKKTQASEMTAQQRRLAKKVIVFLLDMPLPGTIVGWIPASEGTVGLLMLTTSVLTGLDVWERCGREVGRA